MLDGLLGLLVNQSRDYTRRRVSASFVPSISESPNLLAVPAANEAGAIIARFPTRGMLCRCWVFFISCSLAKLRIDLEKIRSSKIINVVSAGTVDGRLIEI